MTEKRSGRNGDNFMWTLTLGLFALGAVSLFLSFGDAVSYTHLTLPTTPYV